MNTDLYQLTMAAGYFAQGRHEAPAVFHLFFRKHPCGGAYAVLAGLADVVDFLREWHFSTEELSYLASLQRRDGQAMFPPEFLNYLAGMELSCDIDAPAEGSTVFAFAPILRVRGPLLQVQLLETVLLNLINFNTLVATKAARICSIAGDDPVLEFGLRRAQGLNGGLSASRSAYIGGCAGTSNVAAGLAYDIPVKGTHAHSWVMSFENETAAFEAYASTFPADSVLLVDTYDTLVGVKRAVTVARKLAEKGHQLLGIRLDSGDLARLSTAARDILNEAGLPEVKIVASNDLDEYAIRDLKAAGAAIDMWGVGTKLATAYDQPALGGVYKLAGLQLPGQPWRDTMKVSDQAVKTSIPGPQGVRRFFRDGRAVGDVIYHQALGCAREGVARQTLGGESLPTWARVDEGVDLLQPLFRSGQFVGELPSIHQTRAFAAAQLQQFAPEVLAIEQAVPYSVSLEQRLAATRARQSGALRAS
ncbi:nicotinate phosphoribosyltransferase [Acanthopleuribacter pedis]|uniref:Nicotinate phosphoribosyltransferase n=1 Tax=Acanthopleuribacter pedis TaxID=442870 RepID=A0A8J7QMH3_9BACT|nr:nicotinate phosphoribosyltransferase [Acanthopleuribacter pedis]MBO1320710.1 nicotinate phosphoribosyltransferase [Acanthopleuribacter pedis]